VATAGGNSSYILNLAQNTTSFALANGEFAYFGADAFPKYGITFNGVLTKGSISSSTVRNGYRGIHLYASSHNILTGNNIYSNTGIPGGISLQDSSNNILTENNCFSNAVDGIYVYNSSNNTLTQNNTYSNYHAIYLYNSSNNTLTRNNTYSNSNVGLYFESLSSNNTLTGNNSYSNSYGIYLWNGPSNNTLIGNNIYSNSDYGIYADASFGNAFIDGNMGYSISGDSLKNTSAEVYYQPGTPAESLILQGVRLNPTAGIHVTGMDVAGASLISYNQDYDTGTVRIWGNYQLAGSTLTLDYTTQLYVSTATTPKLMRGTGHSAIVEATYDNYAVSQLITINYRSGSWHVDGSSTGIDMLTFTGSQPSLNVPAGNPQFSMNFTQVGTPQEGDTVDFSLTAASNDANKQKKLLFGYSAADYNGRDSAQRQPRRHGQHPYRHDSRELHLLPVRGFRRFHGFVLLVYQYGAGRHTSKWQ